MPKTFVNDPNELESFKKEIDIVSFAIDQGYSLDKASANKSAAHTTVALKKKISENDIETILVRKNQRTEHYLYYNPENSDDKGSIIDFVINKLNVNIGVARQKLRQYLGKQPLLTITPSPPFKQKEIDVDHFQIKPLSDPSYLLSRNIAPNIIKHPFFAPTMGIKTVYANAKQGHKSFNNTAFLIKDVNQRTIGLELKNYDAEHDINFKGAYNQSIKKHGMWISIPPKNAASLVFAVIESPIDAMSHFQLTQNPHNSNIFYLSTNGQLSQHHLPYIQHYIDHMRPKSLLLLNDNDLGGIRFNCTLLGSLRPPAKSIVSKVIFVNDDQVSIKVDYIKPKNRMTIEIGHS